MTREPRQRPCLIMEPHPNAGYSLRPLATRGPSQQPCPTGSSLPDDKVQPIDLPDGAANEQSVAQPNHRRHPESPSTCKAQTWIPDYATIQSGRIIWDPTHQEQLQSLAHSPSQSYSSTSGTTLLENTTCGLTQPEVITELR